MMRRPSKGAARGGMSPLESLSAAYGGKGKKISMPKSKQPAAKSTKGKVTKAKPAAPVRQAPVKKQAPAKKPPRVSKKEPITSGPGATHARDVDTGKPVKLSPSARKAVQSYYERQSTSTPTTPAVNLDKLNQPAQFKITDKRRIK